LVFLTAALLNHLPTAGRPRAGCQIGEVVCKKPVWSKQSPIPPGEFNRIQEVLTRYDNVKRFLPGRKRFSIFCVPQILLSHFKLALYRKRQALSAWQLALIGLQLALSH